MVLAKAGVNTLANQTSSVARLRQYFHVGCKQNPQTMNALQKIVLRLFPPYRFKIVREKQEQLIKAIVLALPEAFSNLKEQVVEARFHGLIDWASFPDFKFISIGFSSNKIQKFRKTRENFRISGIQISSKNRESLESVEILVKDSLLCALKISNGQYVLDQFDLKNINTQAAFKSFFKFSPGKLEKFYDNLDSTLQSKISLDEFEEVEFNNRTYFSFFDMEDGNCLAVDKLVNVYSLVHDATPEVKKMQQPFVEIFQNVRNKSFDKDKHLKARYNNS
jgi:hypothetical protein